MFLNVDKPGRPEGPMILEDSEKLSITVSWKPPLDDGGMELTKYVLEKYDKEWGTWIKVADLDKNTTSYVVSELKANAQMQFRVFAQNEIGKSEPLESDTVTVQSPFSKSRLIYTCREINDVFFCRSAICASRAARSVRNDGYVIYDQVDRV